MTMGTGSYGSLTLGSTAPTVISESTSVTATVTAPTTELVIEALDEIKLDSVRSLTVSAESIRNPIEELESELSSNDS